MTAHALISLKRNRIVRDWGPDRSLPHDPPYWDDLMCFSPTASFAAAAVTAAAGSVAVWRCTSWRKLPLAAMPFVFAAQQTVEGGVWWHLLHPSRSTALQRLTDIFIFLALAVWPVFTPLAAALIEEASLRRRLQMLFAVLGLNAAVYGSLDWVRHPYTASIVGNSICYINQVAYPAPIAGAYLLATTVPLLISGNAAVRRFGMITTTGMAASLALHYVAFVSVWCFFAALGSIALCDAFQEAPRSGSGRITSRAALSWRNPK
jgi:hypothetical protein